MDGNLARALLGVPAQASSDQVNRAFRGAVLLAHPDRGGDAARFRQLVAARDVLIAEAPAQPAPLDDPFRHATVAPATASFSVLDVRRPDPVPPTPPTTASTDVDFDTVLAEVLAAA